MHEGKVPVIHYGPRMLPEFQSTVDGIEVPNYSWGTVKGYRRATRRGGGPMILPNEGSQLNVKVRYVDPNLVERYIDSVGDDYTWEQVKVRPKRDFDSTGYITAYALVAKENLWPDLWKPWSELFFIEHYLRNYVPEASISQRIRPLLDAPGVDCPISEVPDGMVAFAFYGTLLFERVQTGVCGADIPLQTWGVLPDYRRYRFSIPPEENRTARGPAIIKKQGSRVNVKIAFVPKDIAWRLHAFEGLATGYKLERVEVYPKRQRNGGSPIEALAYVADKTLTKYLYRPWNELYFIEHYLGHYVQERIPAFLQEHIAPHIASGGKDSPFYDAC